MEAYHTTVRLTDKGMDIRLRPAISVADRGNVIENGRGCPVEYLSTALGS